MKKKKQNQSYEQDKVGFPHLGIDRRLDGSPPRRARRNPWGVGGRREEAARACLVGGEEARRRGLAEGKAPGLLDSGVRGRLFMTVVMSLLAFSFSKFEYGLGEVPFDRGQP